MLEPSWETSAVVHISNRVEEVIRNEYTIGYSPSNQTLDNTIETGRRLDSESSGQFQTPVASFSLDVKSTLFHASERRIDTRVNILAHCGNQYICRSSLRDRVYRDCSGRGGLGSSAGCTGNRWALFRFAALFGHADPGRHTATIVAT